MVFNIFAILRLSPRFVPDSRDIRSGFCTQLFGKKGLAFALNFHWVAMGKMKDGKVCIIQGAVSQVGDLGAAIWSTAIAFHTFWLV